MEAANPGVTTELVFVETLGDRRTDRPLHELGGQGVFVKEVQQAVLDGLADVAVHSAKDLPSLAADGLVLAAVPERGDPRDALVGRSLADLAHGATVATGSVRRRALLAARRPDLAFVELRGNIATRLSKVPVDGSIVMAVAALDWLGLRDQVADVLDPSLMLPQVGQGALALEARLDDPAVLALLAVIEHGPSRRRVDAERAFLAELGGGCDLPVAAYAVVQPDGDVHLAGLVAALDGRTIVRVEATGRDALGLGRHVASRVMAEGGAALLGR